MEDKTRNTDSTNCNQKLIRTTLNDIEKVKVSRVQLSLF